MAFVERYCRADAVGGGNGTVDSSASAWTLAEAIAQVTAGTRVNVRAGTHAQGATARVFNIAGTAIAPICWRGYNTTPGDIEADNSLTKPVISFTTAGCSFTGVKQHFGFLDIQGARIAGALLTVSDDIQVTRCRVENTGANAAASALTVTTTQGPNFNHCFFKAASIATRVVQTAVGAGFSHCVVTGGLIGFDIGAAPYMIDHCIIVGTGSHGINCTGTAVRNHFVYNSFLRIGGDGIRHTVAPTPGNTIRFNLFDTVTGIGINNTTGTNSCSVLFSDNDFAAMGGANYNGWGDTPAWRTLTEASSPAMSTTDPTFSGMGFNGASLNREFENWNITGKFWDVGATQRKVVPAGGARIVTVA